MLAFITSFVVVPMVVEKIGGSPPIKGNITSRFIGDNKKVTTFFKIVLEGRCVILLHGICHQYNSPNGIKTPEMIWREMKSSNLDAESGPYKEYQE